MCQCCILNLPPSVQKYQSRSLILISKTKKKKTNCHTVNLGPWSSPGQLPAMPRSVWWPPGVCLYWPPPPASHRWGLPAPTSPHCECSCCPSAPPGPETLGCHRKLRCDPRGPYLHTEQPYLDITADTWHSDYTLCQSVLLTDKHKLTAISRTGVLTVLL